MSEDRPPTIGLLVEAEADARTVRRLVDRVLCEVVDWLDEDGLAYQRSWRGLEADTQHSFWKQAKSLCREHGVRAHGRFDGSPGAADAVAARRALRLFAKLGAPNVVVLVRDADAQPERLIGLRQARESSKHMLDPRTIAVGVAIPEREAWHLCGFVPRDDVEKSVLAAERQRLGFNPTEAPHRLGGRDKRDPKPVLEALTQKQPEREQACLDVPLEELRKRGAQCGLSEFLAEIEARIVPGLRLT